MNILDQLKAIDPSETQVRSKGHGLTTRQAHVRRADVGALGLPRHGWRRAQGRLRRACGGGGRFTGHGTTPWETAWARTAMGDRFIDLSGKVFRGKVDSSCLTGMTKVTIYVCIVPTCSTVPKSSEIHWTSGLPVPVTFAPATRVAWRQISPAQEARRG